MGRMRKAGILGLLLMGTVTGGASQAAAQVAVQAAVQAAPQPSAGPVILGQSLTLALGKPGDCAAQAAAMNTQGLVLVANGQTIAGARASFFCAADGTLIGTATTTIAGNGEAAATQRAAWEAAFTGFFNRTDARPLPVAFGPITGGMATPPQMVDLRWSTDRSLAMAFVWFALVAVLFAAAFLRHFGRTDAITPLAGVPMPDGYRPPYSLSRFQLLWWSGVVTASYVAILTVTGSMDTITAGTMALMGIVGGTSVLDAFQDRRPNDDRIRRAQHAAAYRAAAIAVPPDRAGMDAALLAAYPPSRGLVADLLSDAAGYNVHRLQLLAWTVVLGISFAYEVARTMTMPELSANLLALTGISNGTYFGFRVQEQQVAPPATTPATPPLPAPLPAPAP